MQGIILLLRVRRIWTALVDPDGGSSASKIWLLTRWPIDVSEYSNYDLIRDVTWGPPGIVTLHCTCSVSFISISAGFAE